MSGTLVNGASEYSDMSESITGSQGRAALSRAEQGRDEHVSKCTLFDDLDLQEACLLRPLAAHVV